MTQYEDVGVWRDLHTGIDPQWDTPIWADGSSDQPGDPGKPIDTRIDGPWGIPWWEGIEDPTMPTGLFTSPNPTYPFEDVGAKPIVGAYAPEYRTHGPVRAWGLEPSGGLYGDQAIGRIMRFPANIPNRYDPNGVFNTDYKDELAAAVEFNDVTDVTPAEYTTELLLWPNVGQY